MKVAVTAASGNLGNTIVNELLNHIEANDILAIARTPEKVKIDNIKVAKGDYNSKEDFLTALKGIDVVLIVSGMDKPENRIQQHRNIIEAAKENGVKKIVYTSIVGNPGESMFDAVVNSNRQTELDIQNSGLLWSIGRNGLYIEPDVEYIEQYKKDGKIQNCASEGLCSYTTRAELAYAYSQMILNNDRNGNIYNLAGEALTQQQLCDYLNKAFGSNLAFVDMTPDAYLELQLKTNGEYLGPIIAGIYQKIRNGEFNLVSEYEAAAGRPHITWDKYFSSL